MRHVRILALCLVAAFATTAMTLGVAAPAFAGGCNQECKEKKIEEKEKLKKEKEEAKEKAKKQKEKEAQEKEEATIFNLGKFAQCPLGYKAAGLTTEACITGEAGPESFFQAGKVTVHFVKPIHLNGGFVEDEIEPTPLNSGLLFVGALNGETISREAEPAPSLTEGIDAEDLPPAEKARYEEYLASGKSTKVTATIELAKPASGIGLDEGNLLGEEGSAFLFPVEIHLSNGFVGDNCYVGSWSDPIEVPFTTGETSPPPPNTPIHGSEGKLKFSKSGDVLQITPILVNNSYAAPGVQGCGVNGGADTAIDAGLGLPSPAGSNTTELIGALYQGGAEAVTEYQSEG